MQTIFGNLLKNNPPRETEVYELKICKGTSLPFASVKEHQIEALKKVETAGFYHKLSDPPVFYGMNTRFNIKRPFDCLCIVRAKAFLVFWFYKPKQLKRFIKVRINDFLELKDKIGKKSFTEPEILGIATEVVTVLRK